MKSCISRLKTETSQQRPFTFSKTKIVHTQVHTYCLYCKKLDIKAFNEKDGCEKKKTEELHKGRREAYVQQWVNQC